MYRGLGKPGTTHVHAPLWDEVQPGSDDASLKARCVQQVKDMKQAKAIKEYIAANNIPLRSDITRGDGIRMLPPWLLAWDCVASCRTKWPKHWMVWPR